jgi:thiosulfate reductase cytochrome b subunit
MMDEQENKSGSLPEGQPLQQGQETAAPEEADAGLPSEASTQKLAEGSGKPVDVRGNPTSREAQVRCGPPIDGGREKETDAGPPAEISSTPVSARICLDKKHPLAIRWMHWINFPVLFTMIWSGLLIYWNDSDNAYKHPHAVYRIGVGPLTVFRFFPHWFWKAMNAPYHVTQGLGYHFFFMWIFAINGILYVSFTLLSGEWRFVVPDRKSLVEAIQVTLRDLHLTKYLPPQTKYNGAQKIAYTSVILMGAGSLITGLAIYKPTQAHWVTTLLGGYEMARWEHFLLTMGFCAFFVVHVTQVVLAGWNNFRSMVSGLEVKAVSEPSLEAERRSWR